MYTDADFGLTGTGPTMEQVIDWMRGEDVKDEDGDPATTVRYAMGDPLHSRPAAIVYGGTQQNPESVIYTATNDGYLHAVDSPTGEELWSYVPKELLPRMARLYDDPEMKYKLYGIDGDIVPVVRDVDNDGAIEPADGDFAFILFGMRRGGMTYRMLNVTDKRQSCARLGALTQRGRPKLVSSCRDAHGYLWLRPERLKAVVVLGGGYDGVHDTAAFNPAPDGWAPAFTCLTFSTGATLWRAGHTSTAADLQACQYDAFDTDTHQGCRYQR